MVTATVIANTIAIEMFYVSSRLNIFFVVFCFICIWHKITFKWQMIMSRSLRVKPITNTNGSSFQVILADGLAMEWMANHSTSEGSFLKFFYFFVGHFFQKYHEKIHNSSVLNKEKYAF